MNYNKYVSVRQITLTMNIGSPSQYFETWLNVDQTRGQRGVKDENNTVSHDASAVHSSPQAPPGGSGHDAGKTLQNSI